MPTGEKNRVTVTIDGRDYTILGDESEEYIRSIADKVDKTIAAVSGLAISSSMKLVLAALNIADESEKKNAKLSELEQLLSVSEEKNRLLQNTPINIRFRILRSG